MQTLYLPDLSRLTFVDKVDKPFRQEDILIGIRTFATYKNDIDLSPFTSDREGHLSITREQMQHSADVCVSYGLMDYRSLESAKPQIEIYLWGTDRIDRYINYWTKNLKTQEEYRQSGKPIALLAGHEKEVAEIEMREREELRVFETCFNRTTNQKRDVVLVCDNWDKPASERNYVAKLPIL